MAEQRGGRTLATCEVVRWTGLPAERVRAFVRSGVIQPQRHGREYLFSLRDLLLLRTTKGLIDARIPPRKIRRSLVSLRRQLRAHRGLGGVRIYADGERVVAWDGRLRWQPDSGQFLFDFDAARVLPPTRAAEPPPRPEAEHWFRIGLELEGRSPAEARHAYHEALKLDAHHAAAHLNLGRLYHADRRWSKAEEHYRAAVRFDPTDGLTHYNLGVLLEDTRREGEAVRAYQAALRADPALADAHYNLARLYEVKGRARDALRHFRTYKRLTEER